MLPLNFDSVLTALQNTAPLDVYDSEGHYAGGKWEEGEPQRRAAPVRAIVLAMGPADLKFYAKGYASAGGIVLHTRETLYFVDVNDTGDGQERRQSYVDYQGYRFRVAGSGLMRGNTTFNTYHCVRYCL